MKKLVYFSFYIHYFYVTRSSSKKSFSMDNLPHVPLKLSLWGYSSQLWSIQFWLLVTYITHQHGWKIFIIFDLWYGCSQKFCIWWISHTQTKWTPDVQPCTILVSAGRILKTFFSCLCFRNSKWSSLRFVSISFFAYLVYLYQF